MCTSGLVFAAPPEVCNGVLFLPFMIEVRNLRYTYPRRNNTLQFPDFTLQRGEQLLLLGQSGSGKTTMLHLVGGLLRGYTGSLKVDGAELNDLSEAWLDRLRGQKIGFVFQRNHLIAALTAEQNVRLACYLAGVNENKPHIDHLLKELHLDMYRKVRVTELSHGQAQRVAIARALVNKPMVLLADEPTSALDDVNCGRVIRLLSEMAREAQAALLIATHDTRLKEAIPNCIQLTTP